MAQDKVVTKTITIHAPASQVWSALSQSAAVEQWLSDIGIRVISDWTVGSPITFVGTWHGVEYQDKGRVVRLEPQRVLQYTYWSAMSHLPDSPEHYSLIELALTPRGDETEVTVSHSHLATDAMYKHANFYWNAALVKIRKVVEEG